MIIRIRSKDGMFRIDLPPTADAGELAQKILEITKNADPASLSLSDRPGGQSQEIAKLVGRSLDTLGLKHGDMLYLAYTSYDDIDEPKGPNSAPTAPAGSSPAGIGSVNKDAGVAGSAGGQADEPKRLWETVQEDPVDVYWRARDGKIPRQRDAKFCKHGAKGMCDYCMPLEPYDAGYHQTHAIKHLSFHTYLRKLQPNASTATSSNSPASLPPLTPEDYRVKVPCPSLTHPSFPKGICTSCQPSTITLQPQPFRMVDHIEFASQPVVDRFLDGWRRSGNQRFGFLIGRYEPYDKVPMGIKCIVEAIHEPLQQGEIDGLTVALPWEDEKRISKLGSWCYNSEEMRKNGVGQLCVVGQIFTDLTPQEEDRTKLIYKRHPKSYNLTGLEAVFAARMQSDHPLKTKGSRSGEYGSRFVTVVVTGTEEGGVDVKGFQVSEQAVAMVQADMIQPSTEPSSIFVKKETKDRYIPEVFYRSKNEYGIDVKESARPAFPVDYLLVNISHGFPVNPSPLFRSSEPFPIENRSEQVQTTDKLITRLADVEAPSVLFSALENPGGSASLKFEVRRNREKLAQVLSDWHLLAYWNQVGFLNELDIQRIAQIATAPSLEEPTLLDPLMESDGWRTLMALVTESSSSKGKGPDRSTGAGFGGGGGNSFDNDGFEEIPPELLDEMGMGGGGMGMDLDDDPPLSGSSSRPISRGGAAAGRKKICPHCTFENPAGRTDCEICTLPLDV